MPTTVFHEKWSRRTWYEHGSILFLQPGRREPTIRIYIRTKEQPQQFRARLTFSLFLSSLATLRRIVEEKYQRNVGKICNILSISLLTSPQFSSVSHGSRIAHRRNEVIRDERGTHPTTMTARHSSFCIYSERSNRTFPSLYSRFFSPVPSSPSPSSSPITTHILRREIIQHTYASIWTRRDIKRDANIHNVEIARTDVAPRTEKKIATNMCSEIEV